MENTAPNSNPTTDTTANPDEQEEVVVEAPDHRRLAIFFSAARLLA